LKPLRWKLAQYPAGENRKNKCWRCGCHLPFEIATVDHLTPKANGGPDKPNNYALACYPCNQERGSMPLTKAEKKLLYPPSRR